MVTPEDTPRSGDNVLAQARIVGKLISLMEALDQNTTPERSQTNFTYYPPFEPLPADLPDSIALCGEPIEQIDITFTYEPDIAPMTSLAFRFGTTPERTLYVSSDPNSAAASEEEATELKDWLHISGEDMPIPIDRIPPNDLYRFMMSLLTGEDIVGYTDEQKEGLTRTRALAPLEHDVMVSSLKAFSHTWSSHYSYDLGGERHIEWTDTATRAGATLTGSNFRYETGTPGRNIIAKIDPTTGLAFKFFIRDPNLMDIQRESGEIPLIPDQGDLRRLKEIIRELTDKHRAQTYVLPNETMEIVAPPVEDPKTSTE